MSRRRPFEKVEQELEVVKIRIKEFKNSEANSIKKVMNILLRGGGRVGGESRVGLLMAAALEAEAVQDYSVKEINHLASMPVFGRDSSFSSNPTSPNNSTSSAEKDEIQGELIKIKSILSNELCKVKKIQLNLQNSIVFSMEAALCCDDLAAAKSIEAACHDTVDDLLLSMSVLASLAACVSDSPITGTTAAILTSDQARLLLRIWKRNNF